MTNAQIIFNNSIALMEAGIINGTGEMLKATIINSDGQEEEKLLEMPEAIHTFATWKSLGYAVKKGEKAKASFPIWKYKSGKTVTDDDGNETETAARMFLTKAFFFTAAQVEPLKA